MADLLNAILHAAVVASIPAIYFALCLLHFWWQTFARNRAIRRRNAMILARQAQRFNEHY
jgi:hypothetical protein